MDLRHLPRIPWHSDKPMTIPEVKVQRGLNGQTWLMWDHVSTQCSSGLKISWNLPGGSCDLCKPRGALFQGASAVHLGARPSCAGFFCSFGLPNNDGGCGDVGAAAPLGADDGHGEGGGGEDSELLLLPAVCTALCGCARDNQRRGVKCRRGVWLATCYWWLHCLGWEWWHFRFVCLRENIPTWSLAFWIFGVPHGMGKKLDDETLPANTFMQGMKSRNTNVLRAFAITNLINLTGISCQTRPWVPNQFQGCYG